METTTKAAAIHTQAELAETRTMSATTLAGTAVGFLSFLILGLVPALYFGGFAGMVMAGGIFGTPVPATLLAQGLVVFGMVLGVLAVGALFLVGGAFAGSMVGWLALAVTGRTGEAADEGAQG